MKRMNFCLFSFVFCLMQSFCSLHATPSAVAPVCRLPMLPLEKDAARPGAFYGFEAEAVRALIVPSPVIAVVKETAAGYRGADVSAGKAGTYSWGTRVELIEDRSAAWYKVRKLGEQEALWVQRAALYIPPDEPPAQDRLTAAQLEAYMTVMRFDSATDYFILTDIHRQLIYVFQRWENRWHRIRTIPCSTGKNESPTIRGTFEITDRGDWFYSKRLDGGAMYWMRFNGSYLFHSVAMDKNRRVIDRVIGDRRSMGCVRLGLADARWLYGTIPAHTGVYIT